jgi:manganese/zinc/iron transport system ATP- binding protein
MSARTAVEVRDLTVAYRERPVLWDVDLDVPAGSMTALVGPNGAGKSTLLKAVLGLVPMAAGQVRVLGQPLDEVRGRVAYVPQRGQVDWDFPVTVEDVVRMGTYGRLPWWGRPGTEEKRVARAALERVGMAEFARRQIRQLSGGQQQRAFLARALAQGGELLILDEPFQGVDAVTEREIVALLRELRDQGATVLAVHHDLQTVPLWFDHVALLNVQLVAMGPVGEVFTEANLRLAYGERAAAPIPATARPGQVAAC